MTFPENRMKAGSEEGEEKMKREEEEEVEEKEEEEDCGRIGRDEVR